jgi:hypothetical protein
MKVYIHAHAKDTIPRNQGKAEVILGTTLYKSFKTVTLTGTDQYGNPIDVTVYMDKKQPLKRTRRESTV